MGPKGSLALEAEYCPSFGEIGTGFGNQKNEGEIENVQAEQCGVCTHYIIA